MGNIVKWASFNTYSGPMVRGKCEYVPPLKPTGFDVIAAAVAEPEGGCYDTVVMYDGTAVTFGLMQWTFTSGRLHKLLREIRSFTGLSKFNDLFANKLESLTGLTLGVTDGELYHDGRRITDFFKLRDICTPPDGRVPKTGQNWEKAKEVALLFSKLGEEPIVHSVQLDFFAGELMREIGIKRPKMDGRTIASYLYRDGWDLRDPSLIPYLTSIRALFFSCWQNSPRTAEAYLHETFKVERGSLDTQAALEKFAKRIAYSSFGRWGVAKAKRAEKPYTSRYQKMAKAINEIMKRKIMPEYWR